MTFRQVRSEKTSARVGELSRVRREHAARQHVGGRGQAKFLERSKAKRDKRWESPVRCACGMYTIARLSLLGGVPLLDGRDLGRSGSVPNARTASLAAFALLARACPDRPGCLGSCRTPQRAIRADASFGARSVHWCARRVAGGAASVHRSDAKPLGTESLLSNASRERKAVNDVMGGP